MAFFYKESNQRESLWSGSGPPFFQLSSWSSSSWWLFALCFVVIRGVHECSLRFNSEQVCKVIAWVIANHHFTTKVRKKVHHQPLTDILISLGKTEEAEKK